MSLRSPFIVSQVVTGDRIESELRGILSNTIKKNTLNCTGHLLNGTTENSSWVTIQLNKHPWWSQLLHWALHFCPLCLNAIPSGALQHTWPFRPMRHLSIDDCSASMAKTTSYLDTIVGKCEGQLSQLCVVVADKTCLCCSHSPTHPETGCLQQRL